MEDSSTMKLVMILLRVLKMAVSLLESEFGLAKPKQ